jgi:Phage integrase, N-terminal SAM-like domain
MDNIGGAIWQSQRTGHRFPPRPPIRTVQSGTVNERGSSVWRLRAGGDFGGHAEAAPQRGPLSAADRDLAGGVPGSRCSDPFRPRAPSRGSFLCPVDALKSLACGNAGLRMVRYRKRATTMTAQEPRFRHPKQLDAGTFQSEISSFRLRLAAEDKAAKTIRTYTEAVQWFAAAYLPEQASWERMESQDIQQWIVWLLGRYSSAYASNQYRALQQFFKWLAAEDELPDPMSGLQPPPVTDKLVPVFTSQELARLEHACAGPASPSAATPRSSRCSGPPASGWPSWPAAALPVRPPRQPSSANRLRHAATVQHDQRQTA